MSCRIGASPLRPPLVPLPPACSGSIHTGDHKLLRLCSSPVRGQTGSGQTVPGCEDPSPLPPQHTHTSGWLVPRRLTLRTATSLPPARGQLISCCLLPLHGQMGPGKGHPANVSGRQGLLQKVFGGQAKTPTPTLPRQGHTLGDPFQLCACRGVTLSHGPSLGTGPPASLPSQLRHESAGSCSGCAVPGRGHPVGPPRGAWEPGCRWTTPGCSGPERRWLRGVAGRSWGAFCPSAWSSSSSWATQSLQGPPCLPRLLLVDPWPPEDNRLSW